jgi:hypothetical protein
MPLSTHQQILVAAAGLLFGLFLPPNPAESVQEDWVDQIARRVRLEYNLTSREPASPEYERYLTQLHSVQQALVQKDVAAVQRGMNHLVRMVATKEGGLSDSSAQSLLFVISEVTPVEYLDETTKSHLRSIREMKAFKDQIAEEVPADSFYGVKVPRQTVPWGMGRLGQMLKGTGNPMITLGAGTLVLLAIGVIVLLVVAVRGASRDGRSANQTNDRTVEALEKKPSSAGSSKDAA